MKNIAIAFTIAIISVCITGCDSGYDCNLNNTSYNNISFYTITDGKEVPYPNPSPLTVSLMINGKDSVMINHITDVSSISLPMSYAQETDTVIFHYEDSYCDSLYITQTSKPFYQSMECGILLFHEIENIECTNVWIEKASIINNSVKFNGDENIRIYFYQ